MCVCVNIHCPLSISHTSILLGQCLQHACFDCLMLQWKHALQPNFYQASKNPLRHVSIRMFCGSLWIYQRAQISPKCQLEYQRVQVISKGEINIKKNQSGSISMNWHQSASITINWHQSMCWCHCQSKRKNIYICANAQNYQRCKGLRKPLCYVKCATNFCL